MTSYMVWTGVYRYSKKKNYDVRSVDLKSIITHGKEGAGHGTLVTANGRIIALRGTSNLKVIRKML